MSCGMSRFVPIFCTEWCTGASTGPAPIPERTVGGSFGQAGCTGEELAGAVVVVSTGHREFRIASLSAVTWS